MALELTQPPIINLTPNQGTATLGGPTGTNLTLGSPNPATDGGVAGFVGDALSATRAALSATYASVVRSDNGQPLGGGRVKITVDPATHEIVDIAWEA